MIAGGAKADFAEVLRLEPDNFHARYNLGLVNLERDEPREAVADFNAIIARYPRFYPAYYARAMAFDKMGNTRAAVESMHRGDELVRAYVRNPERNPLDRPAIQAGTANNGTPDSPETEEEIMDRFNQLVTVGSASQTQLAYNDRIKGRVQDRDVNVDLAPAYFVSFTDARGIRTDVRHGRPARADGGRQRAAGRLARARRGPRHAQGHRGRRPRPRQGHCHLP